jgi:CHASE3 domain sensor protein
MQGFDQTAFAGRGSSLMNSDDPKPSRMQRELEDLEERLAHQENRTFRAVILAMMLAALVLALAAALIVRS